jgi:hypothetical protein
MLPLAASHHDSVTLFVVGLVDLMTLSTLRSTAGICRTTPGRMAGKN